MTHQHINTFSVAFGIVKVGFKGVPCFMRGLVCTYLFHDFTPTLKYLGVVPNNASGRTSLWSDLVKIRTQLQELGAIEGFTDSDVTVAQGDSKKAVVITSAITVVNAMGKLYETVTVA